MVDNVSAEVRRKELLEDSLKYTYPEDTAGIKLRYKDTALVLFKEGYGDPKNFLSFGTRRSSSVSQYGNTPVIVRRSRSSNGELFTVAEQWPSLGARTSVSNYTLIERGERDEESDTEDELDIAVKNLGKLDNLKVAVESEGSVPDDDVLSDKSKQSVEDDWRNRGTNQESNTKGENKKEHIDGKENDNALPTGDFESRKSFMHYDLPIQRLKTEKTEMINEEELIVNQVDESGQASESEGRNTVETALKVTDKEDNLSKKGSVDDDRDKEIAVQLETQLSESGISPLLADETSERKKGNIIFDHITVECHEEKVVIKDSTQQEAFHGNIRSTTPSKEVGLNDTCKVAYTELKIIEPADDEEMSKGDHTKNTLYNEDDDDDDDDDVEFVDAISPVSPKIDIRSERHSLTTQTQLSEEKLEVLTTSSLVLPKKIQNDSISENVSSDRVDKPNSDKKAEFIEKSHDLEEGSKFLELPVRSPTPPKKSPRRSPRSPKSKDAGKVRHSSLVLPLDAEAEESVPKGTRSASPTTKTKEHGRIFTFSLKHEKSKSASSLNSKKGKDKDRLLHKDPVLESPSLSTDENSDLQLQAIGKRIGVRNMVIDGTIKRNFIVIHPSDESDTIGLAPKSDVSNRDGMSHKTPKALSSMKSHISGVSTSKMETAQKISIKADVKEELTDITSSNTAVGPITVPKRAQSKRSRSTEKMLETTHSLAHSANDGQRGSQTLALSSGLSEVDCDSINISSQEMNMNKNVVTSKLCSIM